MDFLEHVSISKMSQYCSLVDSSLYFGSSHVCFNDETLMMIVHHKNDIFYCVNLARLKENDVMRSNELIRFYLSFPSTPSLCIMHKHTHNFASWFQSLRAFICGEEANQKETQEHGLCIYKMKNKFSTRPSSPRNDALPHFNWMFAFALLITHVKLNGEVANFTSHIRA